MALQKTVIDVQAADGLNQKFDSRRLPAGKAAKALNLVKNKQGRLEKRLGFKPLSGFDPFDSGFSFSTGINLGTWNQNVFAIGTGTWPLTNQTVTCLSQYSDDLGAMLLKGQVPETKVASDNILCDTVKFAVNPVMAVSGDVAVIMWLDITNFTSGPEYGHPYWAAIETTTGNFIRGPQVLNSLKPRWIRLAVVGSTFVACFDDKDNTTNIYCNTLTIHQLEINFDWIDYGAIITTATGTGHTLTPFDMRAATADVTDFVIAWEDQTGGDGFPTGIKVERRQVSNPAIVDATFIVKSSPNSIGISAIGVRADATTSRLAVAYAQQTDVTYPTPATAYVIHAATCVYPSMAFINGSSSNDTLLYTGRTVKENPPLWLDVAYCGNTGQLAGQNTWAVAHTPFNAVWNNVDEPGGVPQSQVGRIVTAAPNQIRSAAILVNQFSDGTNNIIPLASSGVGGSPSITYGLTLASRGIEVNGNIYYLGWIPSQTQGSFIALAFDQSRDPVGGGYPMRPVGNIQTRTILCDPGQGNLFGDASSSIAPNAWTGGSEWALRAADINAASYVAYTSGTVGERMSPAWGNIQMAPLTGFSSTQWGNMAAISGGLPTTFGGQALVEQSFLWVPESVLVVMGTVKTNTAGPKWTNDKDSYSWIFTWEQFVEGNFHISARSTPVTITYYASSPPTGQLGTAGIYNPTFYIPTYGATLRQTAIPSGNAFRSRFNDPLYPPTLGVYRTTLNGLVYYRVTDRFFNNADPLVFSGTLPALATNTLLAANVTFQDTVSDTVGNPNNPPFIDDGTHPLLYGDGTNGAPGSLDNFCPPASNVIVRHKERLFVNRGNQVMFTKQRGENAGPGYNEQVNAFFVGSDESIVAMESMDDKLVMYKQPQLYVTAGDGPADDGSGSSFQNPQPVPTDSGCSDPASVRSTPEGQYYMSSAGLRLLTRSLSVEYAGGPVEDEFTTYPDIRSTVLYPGQNRLVFAVTSSDAIGAPGEIVQRDYVLDAWTTAQILDGASPVTPVALVVANAPRFANPPAQVPTLHLLTSAGALWRERDPAEPHPYYDNATYVSTTWWSAPIKQQDFTRFRLWELFTFGTSSDPHGLNIRIAIDDGDPSTGNLYPWVWNTPGVPSIAPGGTTSLPKTRLRSYDGRFSSVFQVQVQDVSDPASSTGQGFQVLGLSAAAGVARGPDKLPPGNSQ